MKERIYVWKSQVGVEKKILQPQVVSYMSVPNFGKNWKYNLFCFIHLAEIPCLPQSHFALVLLFAI